MGKRQRRTDVYSKKMRLMSISCHKENEAPSNEGDISIYHTPDREEGGVASKDVKVSEIEVPKAEGSEEESALMLSASDQNDANEDSFSVSEVMKDRIICMRPQKLYIKMKQSFAFCGKGQLRSIRGTVQVAGFKIGPGIKRFPIYSPNCNALQTITVCNTEGMCMEDLDDEIQTSVREVAENCAIIELSKLNCRKCDYVTGVQKYSKIFSCDGFELPGLDAKLATGIENRLSEAKDHRQAAEAICEQISQGSMPIIMMCGGKNLGKSTYSRYLINKVLSSTDCTEVAFFDTDVGQTEFTPSNFVSLTYVKQPLLGPPFTHDVWPERTAFFGENTPSGDPSGYVRCLSYVFKAFAGSKVPLIINTMGWNKDLGLNLFMDILRMTKATHILQIWHTGVNTRNFQVMTPSFCNTLDGFQTRASNSKKLDYELIQIQSLTNLKTEGTAKITAIDHRDISLCHYFGASPNILSAVPYEVPWSSVALHVVHIPVPPAQIMYALNASVVALVVLPENKLPPLQGGSVRIVTEQSLQPYHSVGLGIIRGIDPERKVFYIISPVPVERIRNVNCLVRGGLNIPHTLIQGQSIVQALPKTVPYSGASRDCIGASAIGRHKHLKRGKSAAK